MKFRNTVHFKNSIFAFLIILLMSFNFNNFSQSFEENELNDSEIDESDSSTLSSAKHNSNGAKDNSKMSQGIIFQKITTEPAPPVVNSISFDKSSATPSDSVKVIASITDDTGVNYGYANIYRPDGIYAGISAYLTLNATSGFFEGLFTPNQYWAIGNYYIEYIYVIDTLGNWGYKYNGTDYNSPILYVSGTTPDTTPPTFSYLAYSYSTVAPGGSVQAIMNLSDNLAGVKDANVYLYNASGSVINGKLLYNSYSGFWETTFTLSSTATLGMYYIGRVFLRDYGLNTINYFNGTDFTTVELQVVSSVIDKETPVIHSAWFSTTSATPADLVKVSTYITDYTGFDYGYAFIYRSGYGYTGLAPYLALNATTGLCEAYFTPNQYWTAGNYYVGEVYVIDTLGNALYKFNGTDYTSGLMYVSGTTPDSIPPTFTYLAYSSSSVTPGGQIKVIANIEDNLAGVNKAYV